MRGRWDIRRLVQRTLGTTPPVEVAQRSEPAAMDPAAVHGVLELALRIGEAMLSLGAAAADVTSSMLRIVRAFGLRGCQLDLTFTSITLSYDPGPPAAPLTVMRVVAHRTADYGRLTAVLELAPALGERRVEPEEAPSRLGQGQARLDDIVRQPHPYSRWLVTLLLGTMAAGVALQLGGGATVAVIAAATTAGVDRALWWLGRWGVPPFFLQAVGAGIATVVAVALYALTPYLPVDTATVRPSLVVASGIVVLLAGLSLVGAAEDAISGFPITASARAFEVMLLTLGIVVGIAGVLDVARRMGVPLVVLESPAAVPLAVQGAASAVVAASWALASYARLKAATVGASVGFLAWLVFTAVSQLGVGQAVASAGAALLVGFVGESLSERLRVPSAVTSVCGIVPLLPGLAIYRALFDLVDQDGVGPGAAGLIGAALVGLGLAAGVTLGELLAAPVRLGTRRLTQLAPRRGPAG